MKILLYLAGAMALACAPTMALAQTVILPQVKNAGGANVPSQGSLLIGSDGAEKGTVANPLVVAGGGGGGSTPTGSAGSPNANVVTVQGITGATPLAIAGAVSAVTYAATSTPITGTSTGAQVVGPFVPVLGRVITVSLAATTWPGGTAQILRSIDGGTTKLPITPAGILLGTYTQQGVDQPWLETEAGATFYLSLPAANIGYRVSQ